jgi:hypothetical protein
MAGAYSDKSAQASPQQTASNQRKALYFAQGDDNNEFNNFLFLKSR